MFIYVVNFISIVCAEVTKRTSFLCWIYEIFLQFRQNLKILCLIYFKAIIKIFKKCYNTFYVGTLALLSHILWIFVSASVPRTQFTRDQINRMIEDAKGGRYYTPEGKLVVGNEPRMTLEDLNRYLQNLDSQSNERYLLYKYIMHSSWLKLNTMKYFEQIIK